MTTISIVMIIDVQNSTFIYKHDKIYISYFKYLSFILISIFNFLIFFRILKKQNSFIRRLHGKNSSFNHLKEFSYPKKCYF